MKPFNRLLKRWADRFSLFVILDARDNSVTLSRRLFKAMGVMRLDQAKVFVFRIPADGTYGFILNPCFDTPTQLADIQYNARYRCIGFETLCPTVNRIFYDYGIPAQSRCRLRVRLMRNRSDNRQYFKILPYAKPC